jgi:hypothetical protein
VFACAGVKLQLAYASIGEALNPQSKIVAARLSYATDTWTFAREGSRSSPATTQAFVFTSTVSWVALNPVRMIIMTHHLIIIVFVVQVVQDFIPPAPPVIPPLPADLFYPFVTSSSQGVDQLTVSGADPQQTADILILLATIACACLALVIREA